jgi:hypothetical protein
VGPMPASQARSDKSRIQKGGLSRFSALTIVGDWTRRSSE